MAASAPSNRSRSSSSSSSSSAGGEARAPSSTPWRPDHRLLVPDAASAVDVDRRRPLVVCFPGSGEAEEEAASPAWTALAGHLVQRGHSVLLFARAAAAGPVPAAIATLRRDLADRGLAAPYVLVAHSYGGAFARAFLQAAPADVAGLVLAETGQEGGLDPRVAADQLRRRRRPMMGAKPVVVVRANSFLGVARALEARAAALAAAPTPTAEQAALAAQRDLLRRSEAEDERLKKAQLRLSSASKYVHLPDCGHHVVRDRPDVIVDEVDWVFSHMRQDDALERAGAGPRVWRGIRKALARLSHRPKNVPCPPGQ